MKEVLAEAFYSPDDAAGFSLHRGAVALIGKRRPTKVYDRMTREIRLFLLQGRIKSVAAGITVLEEAL